MKLSLRSPVVFPRSILAEMSAAPPGDDGERDLLLAAVKRAEDAAMCSGLDLPDGAFLLSRVPNWCACPALREASAAAARRCCEVVERHAAGRGGLVRGWGGALRTMEHASACAAAGLPGAAERASADVRAWMGRHFARRAGGALDWLDPGASGLGEFCQGMVWAWVAEDADCPLPGACVLDALRQLGRARALYPSGPALSKEARAAAANAVYFVAHLFFVLSDWGRCGLGAGARELLQPEERMLRERLAELCSPPREWRGVWDPEQVGEACMALHLLGAWDDPLARSARSLLRERWHGGSLVPPGRRLGPMRLYHTAWCGIAGASVHREPEVGGGGGGLPREDWMQALRDLQFPQMQPPPPPHPQALLPDRTTADAQETPPPA